jgi:hypothetical protein
MALDPEQVTYRERLRRQRLYQEVLDTFMVPESDAPVVQSRANVKPIYQYQKEGPHVGQREEPESIQRFN